MGHKNVNETLQNWSGVMWSDKKRFAFDGPDGLACSWEDLRNQPLYIAKRHSGDRSIIVWKHSAEQSFFNQHSSKIDLIGHDTEEIRANPVASSQ